MSPHSRSLRTIFRDTRVSIVAAVVVSAVVVTLGVVLDHENRNFHRRELHFRTANDAALIQTRLMAEIGTDLAVMRSVANWLATTPGPTPEETAEHFRRVLMQNPHFLSLSVAPDFVVRDVFPPGSANEMPGEDVRRLLGPASSKTLADDKLAARFAGPLTMGADRGGFAILFPVVRRNGNEHTVWGAVRAIVDETQFYRSAGLLSVRGSENEDRNPHLLDLRVALSLKSAPGEPSHVFFGDAAILDDNPVRRIFSVPGATWELSAIPARGWEQPPPNQTLLRLIIMLTGAVIVGPVLLSCLLMLERSRNVATLQAREAKLMEVSQRLQLALDSSRIGIWEVDVETREVVWDRRAAELHGLKGRDIRMPIEHWLAMVHPQDRLAAETHFFTCSAGGLPSRMQYRVVLADGAVRHMRSAGTHYSGGSATRTIGIVRDVTADVEINDDLRAAKDEGDIKNAELELALAELSSREQELEELSRKLDVALDSHRCGIWEVDLETGMQIWDERMHRLYELPFTDGTFPTAAWLDLILPEDRARAMTSTPDSVGEGMSEPLIVRIRLQDGSLRYIRSMGKTHHTREGRGRVIGIAFDITEDALTTEALKAAKFESDLKNAELQFAKSCIEHNALHDPLTKLGNRRKLDQELERLLDASREAAQAISILHIDLDRFKQINDTLGHAAGDAMLKRTAEVLLDATRATDLVARIGGDEFVIVVKDNAGAKDMARLATRIIEDMRQPLQYGGVSSRCGVSIGIAQEKGRDLDTRQMLVNADIALYRAKGMGRNRYEFFTQNLQAEIITAKHIADDILAGLEDHQFISWYQPQFDAKTMSLTGVEALVRWNHPRKGLLTPDRFLKIAEELNVVAAIDRIVLETALKDRMRWTAMGIDIPKVSVNVSSRRLHDESLFDTLKTLPIRPGEIAFELVESIFLDESEDVASENLERIKSLGIEIEIDDFGTGHTSIVSLLKLQPRKLKIDRQLVRPILDSPREYALVQAIIGIAHSLGIGTVAEGVETLEHARVLRDLGCDQLQGYAFAKPLPFDALSIFARSEAWRQAS